MIEECKWRGLDAIRLSNREGEATVTLNGAHVVSYRRAGGEELLWLSAKSHYAEGKPIRGGIPVCWPWFGPVQEPAHGVARISRWEFAGGTEREDGGTEGCFRLKSGDLEAELTVTAGRALRVELKTRWTGTGPMELTEALHTYFRISDIGKIWITGLENAPFVDKLTGETKTESAAIRIDRETDRVYHSSGTTELHDGGRTVRIAKRGSNSTVVWNPWRDKSIRMADFGDDEYPGMVCVETANAGADAVTLTPGEWHSITATIEEF